MLNFFPEYLQVLTNSFGNVDISKIKKVFPLVVVPRRAKISEFHVKFFSLKTGKAI